MAKRKVQCYKPGFYTVCIPKDLAESLGITKGSHVEFKLKRNKLELAKAG
jgi:antitoxin component of MazEF toxin-antitoxin module